jgi:hypothetical protein
MKLLSLSLEANNNAESRKQFILSEMNPVHITPHFFKMLINAILSSMKKSFKWFVPFRFFD